mgnify:CR=1 FL=1
MALASMSEIFERMARNGQEFWEVVLADDMDERQVSREASMAKMLTTWQAMQDAADSYTGRKRSVSGLVGGDGMIALGANAVGCSGKPLGIVATGSGNDFARGLKLPVNRIETAVEGIGGAIVRGSHIDVDMGRVTSLDGGYAVDPSTGEEYEYQESKSAEHPIDRYYAGMLSCGLDASINDRANHSHLPTGTMRYFAAVLVELTHMKRYGYHILSLIHI